MNNEIISIRQLQRNYRDLINQAKISGRPIFLGAFFKKEAVILDAKTYDKISKNANHTGKKWPEIKQTLNWIKQGLDNQNLSQLIYADREQH